MFLPKTSTWRRDFDGTKYMSRASEFQKSHGDSDFGFSDSDSDSDFGFGLWGSQMSEKCISQPCSMDMSLSQSTPFSFFKEAGEWIFRGT